MSNGMMTDREIEDHKNKRLTNLAKNLRRNQTKEERKLWSRLRNRQMDGWKFRRQVPFGSYILDFYCVDAHLVVELDGSQHADERMQQDRNRTAYLEEKGLKVLRFWNKDVIENIEGVLEKIYQTLGQRPAPSPRLSPRRGEGEE